MLKKIARSKRGVGTVIGAVIFIAIIMFLLINVVVWTTNSATSMNQLDAQNANANIGFVGTTFMQRGISLELQNLGPSTSNLIALWITNSSPNYHGLYDKTTTPSFNVQLGVDATNTSLFRVSWKPSTTYTFKVITQMGRLFSESIVSPATPSSLPILYAQEETMLLNNVPYYTLDEYPGNNLGLQLTIPITQAGNYAFGNFTYPLYGLNSIPKGTWCAKYRAMLSISWWQWHWNYNTSVTYYADIRVRSTNGTVVYQQDGVSPSTLTTGSGWGWFWNYPYQGYWTTLQGSNFTFNGYTIPSSGQYYLEVGFCATVTGYEGGTAYLMIDNSALAISNQTSLATTI